MSAIITATTSRPVEERCCHPTPPESMFADQVREHSVFQAPVTQTRSKRSSSRTPLKPPPAAKKRTFKKAKAKPRFSFDLPTGVDATIKCDLERLVKISEEQGKTPPCMAFPWKGYRVWYDPKHHPELHQKHWCFWNRFRLLFLLLALYPPTDNAAARRELTASALQVCLQLLSAFFEEMSYYGMLTAFEDTVHDNLNWIGGRATKHASVANDDSKSPAQEDLGVLFKHHHRRYDQVIANALDSFVVDSSGYRSIPELFETSQPIDPTRPQNLRLSSKALACIALDVSGSNPPKESWVGNRNRAPWKKLLSDRSLRRTLIDRPVVRTREDDFDFEENGEFTALKSSPPVKYQPPSSPTKHLAYYSGLSSDNEDQEQEEGHPTNDHDDEEDKERAQ
ncbi:hypothetical protein GN958_ATG10965 [Phytophthora infestans]|uniref:Uncharacterized protein n=1 Tax=Phytophthora infestans TaxID=4787 RepID=A0A8S9UK43_PHYIN|nr:hypothetical protein GN958_ATG10965 [Phytophthora infestans]